ncbi:MAG: nucleoside recognition domain-containing protein [Cytophagaceae bacterium]
MVLNYIWIGFFAVGILMGIYRVIGYYFSDFFAAVFNVSFTEQDLNVFYDMFQSTIQSARTTMDIIVPLIAIMALWLGVMKVGEDGGAINVLSRLVGPFFHRLFPEIPREHPANGSMLMNFSANMLGLDNAATPLGLKAMNQLQEINPVKETASNAQIMFLVLNTSGLTIIPVSIMALRAGAGAANPADIFLPILLATFFSSFVGLVTVSIYQRINLFKPVILAYLGGALAVVSLIVWYFASLPQEEVGAKSNLFAGSIIIFIIGSFIFLAAKKKINVYESFVDGAKDGFTVAIKIIPYLVAILFAIGVFRASGGMDLLLNLIEGVFRLFNTVLASLGFERQIDLEFVKGLPVAIMKPLSGGGARGLMIDSWGPITNGTAPLVDSFVGRLTSVFQGSTETTFYVLAVYFGSVGIKRTRYAVVCGLIADLAGIIAAIILAYIFFR